MPTAQPKVHELIGLLSLSPHPEGGFFRETYRSTEDVPAEALPSRYNAKRSVSTSIYYMLTTDSFSVMHRVASDEIYHFYLGSPLQLLLLFPAGKSKAVIIGPDVAAGHHPQFVIPRGVWQGSRLLPSAASDADSYGLIGATVAPGFDFADFEEGQRASLLSSYPEQSELIRALTRI